MALDSTQRADTMRQMIQKMFVESNATADLDTLEVRALVDAMDDYLEANQSAINQSIPLAVRQKASLTQKALAMAFVAMKRGGVAVKSACSFAQPPGSANRSRVRASTRRSPSTSDPTSMSAST